MKTKSFYDLIKTKLSQEQLDEVEKQAQLEVIILRSIQKVLSDLTLASLALMGFAPMIYLKVLKLKKNGNLSS